MGERRTDLKTPQTNGKRTVKAGNFSYCPIPSSLCPSCSRIFLSLPGALCPGAAMLTPSSSLGPFYTPQIIHHTRIHANFSSYSLMIVNCRTDRCSYKSVCPWFVIDLLMLLVMSISE